MQLLLGVMGRHIATMGRHSVVRSGSGPCGAFHRVASALWPIARARRYMSADIGSAGGIARDGGSCYAASDAARRLTAWATSRTGSDEEFVDATSEAGCEVSSMKVVISVTESNEAELLSELLVSCTRPALRVARSAPTALISAVISAHFL